MSPIKKEADPNLVAQLCLKANADFDGAQIVLDLITPKLQSQQEWEALIALYVCVSIYSSLYLQFFNMNWMN